MGRWVALLSFFIALGNYKLVRSEGETICNIPETGTLQSGGRTSIRLAATASTYDNYYVGSRIAITGGTGAGASSTVSAYCGTFHTSCDGHDSTGTLSNVDFQMESDAVGIIASTLKLRLPAVDGGGRNVPNDGTTTCSDRLNSPYMTSYTQSCSGKYQDLNIYITRGTGAGQVGLIRAGPDANRDILVTGLFGWCRGGSDTAACTGNLVADQSTCKANNGAQCITDNDCTGGGTCRDPVDTSSTYTIGGSAASSLCNPLCNNVASFTATVDFAVTTDSTSTYSLQRGCYDERFASGMRRLGASGSGAGQQNVYLDWKVLIPNGEVVGRPGLASDGSIVVATARGTLTKISAAGSKFWSIYVGAVVGNIGIGHDDTIYFGSSDRNVWAVSANGITRWRYTTPMPVHASPLVTEDAVYIGDRDGTFYKFNLDGSVAWKFKTQGEIWGGAAMTRDGKVIFGSMDTFLYCVDSTSGQAVWFATAGQEIVGTPLIQDTSIVFGTRENDDEYGQIVSLKMDGSVRWQYTVTSSIESEPVEGDHGEVYVATIDGKIFAVQADGQLLWRYNTGGTGGVCKAATYSTESQYLRAGGGDNTTTDGTVVTLTSAANSGDSYYTGYRATMTLGSGFISTGQFVAVQQVTVQYVANTSTHDTHYTDSSTGDMAIAIKFTTKDRIIAGETITVGLPGLFDASIPSVTMYPQDLSTACTGNSACQSGGTAQFTGASGTVVAGSTMSITLGSSSGEHCEVDNGCAGSTIRFLSGRGAGQSTTIVKYVHATKVATIIEVGVAPDTTTSYSIGPAVVSKFDGAWVYSAPAGSLELTVSSTTGTSLCTSGCTERYIKLANTEASAAGALDGYMIEFVSGMGAGQNATCLKYYGSSGDYACDMTYVTVAPDSTTVYRVGPQVEAGEEITLVVGFGQFTYPDYSGTLAAGAVGSATLAATAAPLDDFYKGMSVEVKHAVTVALAEDISGLEDYSFDINVDATVSKINTGTYLKVDEEVMKVLGTAPTVYTNGSGVSTITVRRAQFLTVAATHTNLTSVEVFEYGTIASYDGATQVATLAANLLFDPTGGFYRVLGTSPSSGFALEGATLATLTTAPRGFEGHVTPDEYQIATVVLGGEIGQRADDFFVGATLVITSGPGAGLRAEITAFNGSDAVATVSFDYGACGGPSFCSPKGDSDAGYGSASGYMTSAYEIVVVGTVTSYTSSYVATVAGIPSAVPDTINVCGSLEAESARYCASYSYGATKTPVALEWASGSWCGAAGGTGWGATSPCYVDGLVVTTSSNKFVYGIGSDGIVRFKHMTGKRIRSPPRCIANADRTVTIYTGSNDHFVYRLTTDAQKVLRGSSWYTQ
mmetsp:Transcript_44134/g.90091  ORF Transcript_44134/g.90091 Transcript_44134/m.90091 type:complete len:1350 (-) Transcript_44134:302-4351(-)|eukprot:CAMPEP_0181315776 /NCGR_PEP_ID=MMETSP1101-20121128/15552_1 /TAXON_ID=46948 /ORGANISM="Rhodomonas abbreviata, Strain Caron Lab Isolate" /LENGTH=1349 /DNA_ID=CAMNT_0023422999 /DNA_START=376 /DNA_END=4425 /DNA_ORIENTATION=+